MANATNMGRMCTTANAQPHTGEWSTTHGRRIHHTRENTNNTRGMATTCMIIPKPQPYKVTNHDYEPHTGMIGITFTVSWYTFFDSPFISKLSKVAVRKQKVPNLQSFVLYQEIFVGNGALKVAPEASFPPILEKKAIGAWESEAIATQRTPRPSSLV